VGVSAWVKLESSNIRKDGSFLEGKNGGRKSKGRPFNRHFAGGTAQEKGHLDNLMGGRV